MRNVEKEWNWGGGGVKVHLIDTPASLRNNTWPVNIHNPVIFAF